MAKSNWVQVAVSDFDFVDREPYKMVAHVPVKMKNSPFTKCKHCGLVYLRNNFSRWAVQKGCDNRKHSSYESQRRKL